MIHFSFGREDHFNVNMTKVGHGELCDSHFPIAHLTDCHSRAQSVLEGEHIREEVTSWWRFNFRRQRLSSQVSAVRTS